LRQPRALTPRQYDVLVRALEEEPEARFDSCSLFATALAAAST
jgi:hypothetical protein